ncbi:MAG: DNA polymerase IV [Gammaproteobacteria bacterium]|nr:DNA polymerase IV [Gammaproteobacteria bacterium]MDH5650490.1 DNA polymerase IV [Gammaproteobacteria bacterium]
MAHDPSRFWERAIILVDMDAFFASIEQLDNPELRGKPVGVTNGMQGTCIITCSYEARRQGVKTGMRLRHALEICPALIQCPSRPERYAQVSITIMEALQDITPDIEIFSVDEAFLDVTRVQKLHGSPEKIVRMTKDRVWQASGLPSSLGLSGDKTTAKYAAKKSKPDGLMIIPPWEAKQRLHDVPVTELCGINTGIGSFLAARGVYTCGDMARLPIGVLGQRFGNPGRRIWYMCQGEDPEKIHVDVPPPKSIGHGKVIPPDTRARRILLIYLLHMSEKVGARLRRHNMVAMTFSVGLMATDGWLGMKMQTPIPINDGLIIYDLCREVLADCWDGEGIHQVHVGALDPQPADGQLELFTEVDLPDRSIENQVKDMINLRFGEFALAPARLLERSTMPNVIAPSWKPFGHRETILHP